MIRALLRLVLATGGAAMAAFFVALFEARAAASALVEGGAPEAPSTGSMMLADLGVLFPVALGVAAVVAIATLVLEPEEPKTPVEYFAGLRSGPVIERLRAAAAAPLFILAVFAWTLGSAHLARGALSAGKPAEAGLTVGIGSVVLFLFMLAVATSLLPVTRRILAVGSQSAPALLDPALTGGAAVVLVLILFAAGIATGDTSGEGGVLGVFGVLKRAELDLRPVANAAFLAAGAYFAPVAFARGRLLDGSGKPMPAPLVAALGALASVLLLAILCARAASAMGEDALVSRGIEKHAPLGKISVAILRRATDKDRDGYSSRFGGGDCNDADKTINPGAIDVPGNGIDEDCSGADTPPPVIVPPPPTEPVAKKKRLRRSYNVILFTIDTLRIDLGFLGYGKPVSPNLDKLAEAATVFERAYSMASYTGKSVGPMMIGRYPSETHRDGGHFNTYFPKNTLVAERAKELGVRTFAAHCHWYFRFPTGLNQGFDVWDTSAIPPGMGDNDNSVTSDRMSALALKLLANPENVGSTPTLVSPDQGGGAPTLAPPGTAGSGGIQGGAGAANGAGDAGAEGGLEAGAVIPLPDGGGAGADGKRFFAWFHFFDPHAQYVPHAGAPEFTGPYPAKNIYDQEVWFTDQHIGKVLDYVRAQPWAEDTAIVVTADHGEAFADHGMSWHGAEIWESLVRVPLVVFVPGEKPRRVSVKRSHIDVAPTILELLGGEPPEDGEMRGQSLITDVLLPEGKEHEERDVFVDMPAGPYNGIRRAIVTGPSPGMKLIHSGGNNYQLFDLAQDPAEKRDLSTDKEKLAPVLARLQAARGRLQEVEVKPDAP